MICEVPVVAVSTLVAYCRLPRAIAAKLQGCTFAVVTITTSEHYVHKPPPCVVAWNGATSSSDKLEVPGHLLRRDYADSTVCQVTIIQKVCDVLDVTVQPLTETDWDVVATQCQHVENNMLKSHAIVFVNQVLCIRISSSLSANFTVQNIKFVGSDQPNGTCTSLVVGRITNATSLLVAPFVKKTVNGTGAADITSQLSRMSVLDANIEEHSHEQVLFVLPETCRTLDSSYMLPSPASHGGSHVTANSNVLPSAVKTSDSRCESEFSLDDVYLSTFLDNSSVPNIVSDTTASKAQTEPNHSAEASSENVQSDGMTKQTDFLAAFVHPLYFITCYESALGRTVNKDEWRQAQGALSRQVIIACVESVRRKAPISSKEMPAFCALTPHALVRLVMSEQVRPGACLLPSNLRKGMHLNDYDEVRLYLVSQRLGAAVLPLGIYLSTICWNEEPTQDVKPLPVHDAQTSLALPTVPNDMRAVDRAVIRSAFARMVEQNSGPGRPFILHDNQVITLQVIDHCSESLKSAACNAMDCLVKLEIGAKKRSALPAHVLLHGASANAATESAQLPPRLGTLEACLEVLSLSATHSSNDRAALATVASQGLLENPSSRPTAPALAAHSMMPLRNAYQRVLMDVLPRLLPAAVSACPQLHVANGVATLVTGAKGTGKTTFLHTLSHLLHRHVSTQTQAVVVDCAELKSIPLEQVLSRLSDAFKNCAGYPTALICLDNLDLLCPASKENGVGTLRDERGCVISLHVEMLLREVAIRQGDHLAALAEGSSVPYARERHVQARLRSATYVVATAESTSSIWPSLLSYFAFRRAVALDSLSESNKLAVICSTLHELGVIMQAPSSAHHEELLVNALQGYRLSDLHSLAKRLCLSVLQKGQKITTHTFVATTEDALAVAATFQPVSTSAQANAAKKSSGTALSRITWADVSAYESVRCNILDTIMTPLIYAKLFRHCPIKLPRSVLLYGPPGCGKTLLAQAAGSEFGRGFIAVRGPELLDKYIGASEKAVRDLFQRARDSNRPCLIFFDEFESLAPRRGKDNTGVTDRIVNQLLTFIDGVEATMSGGGGSDSADDHQVGDGDGSGAGQVFIMAATSRPDLIDPALLRPGRIEKHIYVGLPEPSERRDILAAALVRLSVNLDTMQNAVDCVVSDSKAPLLSAADWKAVVNTAFLAATHDAIESRNDGIANSAALTVQSTVTITDAHLRAAYAETKPSISNSDLEYYDSIYARFGHKPSPSNDPAAAKKVSRTASTDLDAQLKQSYH